MADVVWSVEAHLDGKPAQVRELYDRFIELVAACGPFAYSVSKSAITLKGTRRGFAGAKPKAGWLDGYLDLRRPLDDPRIRTSSPYTKRLFVNQYRVVALDDLDDRFAEWVAEAYAVGAGAHLNAE